MPVNERLDLAELRSVLERAEQPWRMAYTSMTALNEEDRVLRLGVRPTPGLDESRLEDDVEQHARQAQEARAESVGAPSSFDLRNVGGLNYGTPVKDQGACGSCVAFGVAAMLEHVVRYTNRAPQLPMDLSEAQLFYCYGRQAGATCGTGWWPAEALNFCRDSGLTFNDYFPYTAGDQDCSKLKADWPNHLAKVVQWHDITGNASAMKEYISTYGSVSACFDVYQDFFSYGGGVYRHLAGNHAGGHCVSLIGYDDDAGYWIAKNSWGAGWGDNGYVKIAYGQCRIESWHTSGVSGVTVKTWLPDQQILGLWSNDASGNVWAYGSIRGWLSLNGPDATTDEAMLVELAASQALGNKVGLYEDSGSVQQIYAW